MTWERTPAPQGWAKGNTATREKTAPAGGCGLTGLDTQEAKQHTQLIKRRGLVLLGDTGQAQWQWAEGILTG